MLLWQNLYRQPGLVHLEPASGPVGRGGESTLGSGWEEQKAALTWGEEQLHGSPELSKCCCSDPSWREGQPGLEELSHDQKPGECRVLQRTSSVLLQQVVCRV